MSAGGDGIARRWDLTTGEPLGLLDPGDGAALTVVTTTVLQGRAVAVIGGQDGSLRCWDVATGTPAGPRLDGHGGAVTALAVVVLTGRTVLVSTGADHYGRIWDLATGQQLQWRDHRSHAVAPVWFDDRPLVAFATDRSVRLWDLFDGTYHGPDLPTAAHAVASTPLEGSTLAIVERSSVVVAVWDLHTNERIGRLPLHSTYTSTTTTNVIVTAQVDGRPMAVTGDSKGLVRVWDPGVATGRRPVR